MPKLTSTATPDGAEPQRRKPLRGAELKRRSTPLTSSERDDFIGCEHEMLHGLTEIS
jgi:hypothetical protein